MMRREEGNILSLEKEMFNVGLKEVEAPPKENL